jgi:pyruvate formate-lyase activating enzyme-like uncharacterized protein
MLTVITKENIGSIENPLLRKDALPYVEMYEHFIRELINSGVPLEDADYAGLKKELVARLERLGVRAANNENSLRWGRISPSCEHCRTGDGSSTFIISLKCNRDCFFCVNKDQPAFPKRHDDSYDIIKQFNKAGRKYDKMKSAAITGGEPLLFPDECVDFINYIRKRDENIETRIYTNGDLAEEKILKRLAEAGLAEIRFGLKTDNGRYTEKALNNLETAAKYIPRTMVEIPIIPGELEKAEKLMDRLEDIGVYGINILEFLFPWIKDDEYKRFKLKKRPYKILFDYTYAGGVPVSGSEIECLKLLEYIAGKKYGIGAHYCSLENKLTAQIWHHNRSVVRNPIEYLSEHDFFIKTARAYGADAIMVKEKLDGNRVKHYFFDKPNKRIDFSVKNIPMLKGCGIELGISYMVCVGSAKGTFLKEIAVNKSDTESFSMDDV